MTSNPPARGTPPLYVVPFRSAATHEHYFPLVTEQYTTISGVTVPHGLDREVAAALPGLWYCLHLPNTLFELSDVPAPVLKASQTLSLEHRILLVPVEAFDRQQLEHLLADVVPVLAVCPDELVDEVERRATELGFVLPPTPYSQLSSGSLQAHWRAIHARLAPDAEYLGREPQLARRLDIAPVDLPRRWLDRQFGDVDAPFDDTDEHEALVWLALESQTRLAVTARLERENASLEEARQRMPTVADEERTRLRVPVVLALPGVSSAYTRLAYDKSLRSHVESLEAIDASDTWSVDMNARGHAQIERATIEFVATHRAVARGGAGLMLPGVSREAFGILAQLEQHFGGPTQRGSSIWRLLDRLDSEMAHLWTDALVALVSRASALTVFSNFPVGLLRIPGDTSPLATRVPIAYRPLLPLTRTLQDELGYSPGLDLSGSLRVLVAECILPDDPVGAISRAAWNETAAFVAEQHAAVSLEIVETLSVRALRGAIEEHRPEILVISAHGRFVARRQIATLQVGDDLVLGPDLGPLPPVVILSACHVAPRGGGTVSITDLLLREGAVAVLGTQIPVDVRRNAILMGRLFVYITEALAGREHHVTLLDVWRRVQSLNAVHDVISGNNALHEWGMGLATNGRPVIVEFTARSEGQLRRGHVYADTERVLGEIADDDGKGQRIRNLIRQPGYVPESLFYVFAGRPERIYLRPVDDLLSLTR